METKQKINQMEFVKKWNEHLDDFDRLLSSFEGDHSDFQKFKGQLQQAKHKMQECIQAVKKNIK